MTGRKLSQLGLPMPDPRGRVWVKAPVFPFSRFGIDPVLGPEMRSTGEVMGSGPDLGHALVKALRAAGCVLHRSGAIFVSLNRRDRTRPLAIELARMLRGMEAEIYATEGTARFLMENGVKSQILSKLGEGGRDAVTILREAGISLILNTPAGGRTDAASIRVAASANGVACVTTLQGSIAALRVWRCGNRPWTSGRCRMTTVNPARCESVEDSARISPRIRCDPAHSFALRSLASTIDIRSAAS